MKRPLNWEEVEARMAIAEADVAIGDHLELTAKHYDAYCEHFEELRSLAMVMMTRSATPLLTVSLGPQLHKLISQDFTDVVMAFGLACFVTGYDAGLHQGDQP